MFAIRQAALPLFVTLLIASGAFLPSQAYAAAVEGGEASISRYRNPNDGLEQKVRAYFEDIPVMIEVARCESEFRHYHTDGTVRKNMQGSSATGVLQIMASIHRKTAANLGFDIDTPEGNMQYARHLYEKNGTWPWLASKYCWNAPKAVARTKALERAYEEKRVSAKEDEAADTALTPEHHEILSQLKTQLVEVLESMTQKATEEPLASAQ
ncbi:hypothetical protein FJY94_03935 [Candidatus Kaiserbacteria bacterium]|nr:hypothetical protein [Candidatus Kaiserbacteria bacterium]